MIPEEGREPQFNPQIKIRDRLELAKVHHDLQ
jgi:hypothetical protein